MESMYVSLQIIASATGATVLSYHWSPYSASPLIKAPRLMLC